MKNKKIARPKRDFRDQIKRLSAELENSRKRHEQDKMAYILHANRGLILEILPVLDNFKRAAEHAPQSDDAVMQNWIVGIKAVEKQLEEILKQAGVSEVPAQAGQPFDHHLHEAISHEPSSQPIDTIIAVIETGYQLNHQLLRPAKVRVSAGQQ